MTTAQAPLLAAWESAAVQTLNPLLTPEQADALWAAILAFRSTGDLAALATDATAALAGASPYAHDALRRLLDDLLPLVSPAADAATE